MYYVAVELDKSHNHPDEAVRKESDDTVALLTPIVKAFITDNGWKATSECLQVFGGHGYIAEWGMEQYVRDARINMIYEGTNTIQALDLLGRIVAEDFCLIRPAPAGAACRRRADRDRRSAGDGACGSAGGDRLARPARRHRDSACGCGRMRRGPVCGAGPA